MNKANFDEVIEAILDGKYSWACILFLCGEGHNPLQYMPYRTYHRLMKANRHQGSLLKNPSTIEQCSNDRQKSGKISDLNYLRAIDTSQANVSGGWKKWFQKTTSPSLRWTT